MPPGLLVSLLEGLPGCGTLKSLVMDLFECDVAASHAVGRVVPHLCLDELVLIQHRPRATDREDEPVILRSATAADEPTRNLRKRRQSG